VLFRSQIIKEASRALMSMPMIIFFPLWIYAAIVGLMIYFVIVMLMLYSFDGTSVTVPIINIAYTNISLGTYMMWYHVAGFIWTFTFLSGVNQITIAGAIAQWYWTRDKSKRAHFPAMKSFYRVVRYHLGSVALGSLLLTIVEVIRLVVWRFQRVAKQSNNKVLQYLLCCLQCCLKCVQVIMKFVNKNAYICIAVTGKSFFKAAAEASGLLIRNALRLVAVDFIADFLLFVSKIAVTAMTGIGCYLFMTYYKSFAYNNVQFPFITVAFVSALAFMVSTAFFSIYHLAVDTIFFSFLEDSEKNDGSMERPYYMSDNLKKIIGASQSRKVDNERVQVDSF